jgi:hypothetical protein
MAGSHAFGTGIKRGFDARMLGQAIKAPGLDLRYWCSMATVCTVDPETGDRDTKDKLAVHNTSAGIDVDVELEPLGQPCTCKYAGIQTGEVTIYAPIRPGDLVLVECPDGDLTTPVITHILNSRSKRQPIENGKPIFDNNRLLIHAKNVPIDIRTAGGVQVLLEQDGTATVTGAKVILDSDDTRLGGADASEANMLGTTFANAQETLLDAMTAYVGAMASVDPSGGTASTAMMTAIAAFQAIPYLSDAVKTK